MARKRVTVTEESPSGRNERFHDNYTGEDMTREKFVDKIKDGDYPRYHTRVIDKVPTPVSNPDGSDKNNLG